MAKKNPHNKAQHAPTSSSEFFPGVSGPTYKPLGLDPRSGTLRPNTNEPWDSYIQNSSNEMLEELFNASQKTLGHLKAAFPHVEPELYLIDPAQEPRTTVEEIGVIMIHLDRMRRELARRRLVLPLHRPSANFENTNRPVDEISNEMPGDLATPSGASASGENDLTKGKPDLAGAEVDDTAQYPEDVQSGSIYPDKKTVFTHSVDYRSVCINGKSHDLTVGQATIVRILHEALQHGTPCVGKATLLAAVQSETSRVQDFFKHSPLWQTLVKSGQRRGTYRLNLPDE